MFLVSFTKNDVSIKHKLQAKEGMNKLGIEKSTTLMNLESIAGVYFNLEGTKLIISKVSKTLW